MAKNKNLSKAKKAKNDEFYTQLSDIENELKHYKDHFRDKVVYCNCDDPYESNFTFFFLNKIKEYGIKRVICTCYDGSPIANQQLSLYDYEEEAEKTTKHAHVIDISQGDLEFCEIVDCETIQEVLKKKKLVHRLHGNGDFRSEECVELLKEADIVCTNPPFSQFRSFVNLLMEYDKKFLIIGNQNAITYKEIFPLIKENKIWLGTSSNKVMKFEVPDSYEPNTKPTQKELKESRISGKFVKVSGITWFTNLEHSKRNEELVLWKRYAEEPDHFPKYDNYDAINVDKVVEIPMDYDGVMGVPITFLDKYNPEQFEIVGQGQGNLYRLLNSSGLSKKFVDDYYKSGQKGLIKENHPVLGYYDKNGKPVIPYMRILIRNKKVEKR